MKFEHDFSSIPDPFRRFSHRPVDLICQVFGADRLRHHRDFFVAGSRNTEFAGNFVEKFQHLGVFLLGQQVDLQIEVGPSVVQAALNILGGQDEDR